MPTGPALLSLAVGLGLIQLPAAVSAPQQPPIGELAFLANNTGNDLWEVAVAGTRFTSRDEIEGRLLLQTAQLARAKNRDWFVLVPRPGESSGMHPVRPTPTFGAQYSRWHAQWYYWLENGRRDLWRPEWGAPFWSSSVDLNHLKKFEAHALVQLGTGPVPEEGDVFYPSAVTKDLTPIYAAIPKN